jgi:hypothetical protein
MRFRNGSDKGRASNFEKISEKIRRRPCQWLDKRSGKRAWAVHAKSKLTETEKGETGEGQSQEHFHHYLWHQEYVLAGQTANSAYYCDVLRQLYENVRRLLPELWHKRTGCCIMTTHRLTLPFSPGNFLPKKTLLSSLTHPTFQFPRLKTKIKGSHFDTAEVIEA